MTLNAFLDLSRCEQRENVFPRVVKSRNDEKWDRLDAPAMQGVEHRRHSRAETRLWGINRKICPCRFRHAHADRSRARRVLARRVDRPDLPCSAGLRRSRQCSARELRTSTRAPRARRCRHGLRHFVVKITNDHDCLLRRDVFGCHDARGIFRLQAHRINRMRDGQSSRPQPG